MTKFYIITKPVLVMFLLSGILLAGACKKVDYHQLTDEDMSWLVYKNNQIDRFTNGSNKTVTYLVGLRIKSYYENGDQSNEYTSAFFQQLNDTSAIYPQDSQGTLYIYKPDDQSLLVTLTWPHFPLQGVPLVNLPQNTVTIGGINYYDVFILNASGFTDIRFNVSKIWYSKSNGVIQYEDTSGSVWVRD